jgi:hypothetical protein
MQIDFTIRPATKRLIRRSFPFGQSLGIADIREWERFVARYARPGTAAKGGGDSGVIAAENPLGYVCGLLFYRVDRHRQNGVSLICDPFLVADMPRYETPARALLDAADGIAIDRGCRWVCVVLPAGEVAAGGDLAGAEDAGCKAALRRAGYAPESVSFRRRRALPTRKIDAAGVTTPGAR